VSVVMLRSRIPIAGAGFIEPCLPSLATKPPSGPEWIHEIKHDGYRLMICRDTAGMRLLTRRGYDWTARFPAIASAASVLRAKSFLIDGEAVCCDDKGIAVFDKLRQRRNEWSVFLVAFDLLELNGRDLRREPIEIRKAGLARLLRNAEPGLQLSEHIEHEAAIVFEHACKLGLEGIVSKRRGSRYQSGRSSLWLKSKNPEAPAVRRLVER
jgi:bifunctional non-homologous end joining protein LigD